MPPFKARSLGVTGGGCWRRWPRGCAGSRCSDWGAGTIWWRMGRCRCRCKDGTGARNRRRSQVRIRYPRVGRLQNAGSPPGASSRGRTWSMLTLSVMICRLQSPLGCCTAPIRDTVSRIVKMLWILVSAQLQIRRSAEIWLPNRRPGASLWITGLFWHQSRALVWNLLLRHGQVRQFMYLAFVTF